MKYALCKVSPELLCDKLPLPHGTEIDGATWDPTDRTVVLSVRHDDLPDVLPSRVAPFITPHLTVEWK